MFTIEAAAVQLQVFREDQDYLIIPSSLRDHIALPFIECTSGSWAWGRWVRLSEDVCAGPDLL